MYIPTGFKCSRCQRELMRVDAEESGESIEKTTSHIYCMYCDTWQFLSSTEQYKVRSEEAKQKRREKLAAEALAAGEKIQRYGTNWTQDLRAGLNCPQEKRRGESEFKK